VSNRVPTPIAYMPTIVVRFVRCLMQPRTGSRGVSHVSLGIRSLANVKYQETVLIGNPTRRSARLYGKLAGVEKSGSTSRAPCNPESFDYGGGLLVASDTRCASMGGSAAVAVGSGRLLRVFAIKVSSQPVSVSCDLGIATGGGSAPGRPESS